LGIIENSRFYHRFHVMACRELGVSYQLLDISRSDWLRQVNQTKCDAYLAWPSAVTETGKQIVEDRLRIMEEQLGKLICPGVREIWLYENKRRPRDWLAANGIPHPETWVFCQPEDALEFVRKAEFPLVFKTNCGAASSGVHIRRRRQAAAIVRRAFGRGIAPRRSPHDRQRGSVMLQEYLPEVKEWRMIRVGDSFFGYLKGRIGDYHSGTHVKHWKQPSIALLDLLRRITEAGRFTSMNADIFETREGRLLVNELHTVFGQSTPEQARLNGSAGRYLFDEKAGGWKALVPVSTLALQGIPASPWTTGLRGPRPSLSLLACQAAMLALMLGLILLEVREGVNTINRITGIALVALYLACHVKYVPAVAAEVWLFGGFILYAGAAGMALAIDKQSVLLSLKTLVQDWPLVLAVSGVCAIRRGAKTVFRGFVFCPLLLVLYCQITGDLAFKETAFDTSRAASLLDNANQFGFCVLYGVMGLAYCWKMEKGWYKRVLIPALGGLFSYYIVLTGSRKSFLALFVFVAAWLWFC
jgi:hypothetical protein